MDNDRAFALSGPCLQKKCARRLQNAPRRITVGKWLNPRKRPAASGATSKASPPGSQTTPAQKTPPVSSEPLLQPRRTGRPFAAAIGGHDHQQTASASPGHHGHGLSARPRGGNGGGQRPGAPGHRKTGRGGGKAALPGFSRWHFPHAGGTGQGARLRRRNRLCLPPGPADSAAQPASRPARPAQRGLRRRARAGLRPQRADCAG